MSSITFMIGNGFDLACGLKSKYSDSYEQYNSRPSHSECIKRFKDSINENIETWANFEMKLADYAHCFSSETELVECIQDYNNFLNEYLVEENRRFQRHYNNIMEFRVSMINEMFNSINGFYYSFVPNDQRAIASAMNDLSPRIYQFINFNYTSVADIIIQDLFNKKREIKSNYLPYDFEKVIHIHGTLNDNIVMGVDNESQLHNLPYKLSNKGKRRIIKTDFIEEYDNERKQTALRYIAESNVICTVGLSLESPDLTWRKALADWILSSEKHHLVIFVHTLSSKAYSMNDAAQKMDDEEDEKRKQIEKFFPNLHDEEQYKIVFKQIHIPIGSNAFSFQSIVDNHS